MGNPTFVDMTHLSSSCPSCLGNQCLTPGCEHDAQRTYEWAPGHGYGRICDCCLLKIWEETKANVEKAIAQMVVRCPDD